MCRTFGRAILNEPRRKRQSVLQRGSCHIGLAGTDEPTSRKQKSFARSGCVPCVFSAIESSCDESAAAVYDDARGLLAHELFSQVELHRIFGGVVPELASRDHVRRLLPLVKECARLGEPKPSPASFRAWCTRQVLDLIGALLTGCGAGTESRLWVGDPGTGRASPRGSFAGAAP